MRQHHAHGHADRKPWRTSYRRPGHWAPYCTENQAKDEELPALSTKLHQHSGEIQLLLPPRPSAGSARQEGPVRPRRASRTRPGPAGQRRTNPGAPCPPSSLSVDPAGQGNQDVDIITSFPGKDRGVERGSRAARSME